jgi:hypothetical protein
MLLFALDVARKPTFSKAHRFGIFHVASFSNDLRATE